jgi:thioredoxin-dependent peroxiredoxin
MPDLKEGDEAPDFTLSDADGREMKLSDFRGRKVVLYFYPKDDTPGCTREACDFRDRGAAFDAAGAVVLGVSPDGAGSHARFREKYGLPFALLSDPEKKAATAYGVYKEKTNYGKTAMGIERSTFLIDERGTITRAVRKVKVDGHAEEILGLVGG